MNERIYIGMRAFVLCLDKLTGREIWRTKVKSSTLINVSLHGDMVVAYARGHLFGLRAEDGKLLWKNGMPGLGYGYCMIASEQSAPVIAAVAERQAQSSSEGGDVGSL